MDKKQKREKITPIIVRFQYFPRQKKKKNKTLACSPINRKREPLKDIPDITEILLPFLTEKAPQTRSKLTRIRLVIFSRFTVILALNFTGVYKTL